MYVYANPNSQRDPIRLFKKFTSLMPTTLSCKSLYLCPLIRPTNTKWYGDQPYGDKKIKQIVKNIFTQAKIKGKYTNHSLRRTAATRMSDAKVTEKVIKEVTGHTSDCVRMYMRTADTLKYEASLALYGQHPNRIVTCEVTPPSSSIVNTDKVADPKVTTNISTQPPVLCNDSLPRIRCENNHNANPDIVHMCKLVQKKINEKVGYDVIEKEYPRKNTATSTFPNPQHDQCISVKPECNDFGVQVNMECENCTKIKSKETSAKNTAVDSTGKISIDINLNVNMK